MSRIQPYIFGGVAWRRYQLNNSNFNTSDVNDKDDVLELPVGVGLAYKYKGLMLDARGELRGSFYDDLVPSSASDSTGTNNNTAPLHRFGINANVGYEF